MISAIKHRYAEQYPDHSIDKAERIINGMRAFNQLIGPVYTSQAKMTLQQLAETHDHKYLRGLKRLSASNTRVYLDPELVVNKLSYPAASRAAAMLAEQAQLAVKDQRKTICFSRPGSHHAGRDYGMGLCLINNLAVAANKVKHSSRVVILDFDAHHGNGTEDIFLNDKQVLTISIHQKDFFPGTGYTNTNNDMNYNFPLPAGSSDSDYQIFNQVAEIITNYQPQLVLVEAGVDGHANDPYSELEYQNDWFNAWGKFLRQLPAGVVAEMGGGYNPAAIDNGWLAFLEGIR